MDLSFTNSKYNHNDNINNNIIELPNNSNLPKFKDDVIIMLTEIEENLNNKYKSLQNLLTSTINSYETRLINIENKLNLHTTNISKLIIEIDKCVNLLPTEKKNSETLISHEIKIHNLNKEVTEACYKYDKLFLNNLVIPGQIGDYCRFKNVKECLNFLITQTSTLNDYKEKMTIDVKTFKFKCNEYFKKVSNDIENNKEVYMKITTEKSEIIMDNCNQKIKEYLDKLEETKIENYSYTVKLKESSDNLISETNKIYLLKNDIFKSNNEVKNIFQEMNKQCLESVSKLKVQFDEINKKFHELKEKVENIKNKKNEIPKNLENNKKEQNKIIQNNNSLPNIPNKTNHPLILSNQNDNLSSFGLKIFTDNKTKHNPRKSLPKFRNKNFSLIIREGNERSKTNEIIDKRSKSKENLLSVKNKNDNFNKISKFKSSDNHLIYKMIKNEKGSLMKTSSSTYFKPKKGI